MDFAKEINLIISRLNAYERSYVKRRLKQEVGQDNYTFELFECFDREEAESEKQLKEKLAHIRNWHKAKTKFTENLIESLGKLQRTHSLQRILLAEMDALQVLFFLGSLSTSLKRCNNLIEKCKLQEAFFFLPQLLDTKMEIAISVTSLAEQNQISKEVMSERQTLTGLLNQLDFYKNTQLELWIMLQNDTFGSAENVQRVQQLLESPTFNTNEKPSHRPLKIEFYEKTILATLYYYLKDPARADFHFRQGLELLRQHTQILVEDFLSTVHLYKIGIRVHFWLFEEPHFALNFFGQFRSLLAEAPISEANRSYLERTIMTDTLSVYSTPPHHQEGIRKIGELQKFFERIYDEGQVGNLPEIYVNIALIYLFNHYSEKSLEFAEKIPSLKQEGIRIDTFLFANLVRLLAAVQIQDQLLIENTYRSVSRFLKPYQYLGQIQEAIFTLARGFQRAQDDESRRFALNRFLKAADQIAEDPAERWALKYVDFHFFARQELDRLEE